MDFDQPVVVRVTTRPDHELAAGRWPRTVPAVEQVLSEGLELAKGVTFLVGENGSGKSTLLEGIAMAYGFPAEGGTRNGGQVTRATESDLFKALQLQRGLGAGRWGFFLRAETMHGWYTYGEQVGGASFHELSHGESFLEVLRTRFDSPGFYCLDEPEAALSFTSTLGLMAALNSVTADGGQVLCATHSPVLAALPGATILELGPWGLRRATWDELDVVFHWKTFLDAPDRYLRHL